MSEIDKLVGRISECETIVGQLDGSEVWNIISKDCLSWVEQIDERWQHADNDQLAALRVQKLAYSHILNIKERYKQDLEAAKKALTELESVDTNVIRDFDNRVTG